MLDKILKGIGAFVLLLFLLAIVGLAFGYPVKWLMNYLFTPGALLAVFGIAKMTFWKAFWFCCLCGMLIKSGAAR